MRYTSLFKTIFLSSAAAFFAGGCGHTSDPGKGPAPVGTPYDVPAGAVSGKKTAASGEETLVNDAVSSLSLKMALSAAGPYRILCRKQPSSLTEKIFASLASMGMIRNDAEHILYLTEEKHRSGIRIRLTEPHGGKLFFEHDISEKESKK